MLTAAIFFRIILSWFRMDPSNPLVMALHEITEPILGPLRRVVPRLGMFDLTPMVAIILIQIIGQTVVNRLA